MTPQDYEILVNSMPGNERPPDFAVKLLEDTCEATGLDWKRRHVYLMKRGGKWGVTLSIDGFRLIGAQDPEYAGQEGPFWVTKADGTWTDIPPDGAIYAAKVGIKHKNGTTTWGVAKFKDYAAGAMWAKFPSTMVAKCAEMLAWRKAMPGKLGGLYGVEEMEQAGFKPKAPPTPAGFAGSEDTAATLSEGDVDSVKNAYILALNRATEAGEIKAIGAKIKDDKGLSMAAVLELHKLYTERLAKCP